MAPFSRTSFHAVVVWIIATGGETARTQDGAPRGSAASGWQSSEPRSILAGVGGAPLVLEAAADDYVYVVAWAFDPETLGERLFARTRTPAGDWLPPVKISNNERWLTNPPRLAVSDDGGIVLAAWSWAVCECVHLAWSNDHGQTFTRPAVEVRGPPGDILDVALDHAGSIHIAWRGRDPQQWDIFYTHSMTSLKGDLPLEFWPWLNVTDDAAIQTYPSLALDERGDPCVAFDTHTDHGYQAELTFLTEDGVHRRPLALHDQWLRVSTEGRNIAAPYGELHADFSCTPRLLSSCGDVATLADHEIPTYGWATAPDYARSTRVDAGGTITIAMTATSEQWLSSAIELTRSFDCGCTFTPPFRMTEWPSDAHWGSRPALDVDRHGTVHIAYEGPPEDPANGTDAIYVAATYRD
jgi:hypothetical protein